MAPAAIITVSVPVVIAINSTIITESTVLKNCSKVCASAVTFKFCLPVKYPLITQDIATKNIDGESATRVSSASGICRITFDIYSAPQNNIALLKNPIKPKVTKAILKILCAPLVSPTATLSETSFDKAPGIPTEDIVKNKAYT